MRYDLSLRNILVILPHRKFKEREYFELKAFLDNCGGKIIVASSSNEPAEGMSGVKVAADVLIADVEAGDFDAILLVGGIGSNEYWHDRIVHQIVKDANDGGKLIGALCLAPVTLANADLLRGKKATAHNSAKSFLTSRGVEYTGNSVEISGNIVTARGPEATEEFAETLAGLLARRSQVLNI